MKRQYIAGAAIAALLFFVSRRASASNYFEADPDFVDDYSAPGNNYHDPVYDAPSIPLPVLNVPAPSLPGSGWSRGVACGSQGSSSPSRGRMSMRSDALATAAL